MLGLQRPLSVVAGLFLLVWTFLIRGHFGSMAAGASARWIVTPMSRFLQRPSLQAFAALGLLNGLLPCGFVYVALAGAVATGNALDSGLYMALFGLGTVPALLAIRSVPALFPISARRQFTRLMPLAAVAVGALLLIRGLYVPPASTPGKQAIPVCHGKLAGMN